MDEQRFGDGGRGNRGRINAPLSYFAHTPEWMTIAAQGTSDQAQTEWLSELSNSLILLKSELSAKAIRLRTYATEKQTEYTSDLAPKRKLRFRHGFHSSTTYTSWRMMHERCRNRNAGNFADYGGRGIRVCKRWSGSNGFWSFLLDMGERPEGLTLDRIDVNRGYNRHNCRWATKSEQQRNRRVCK